MTRSSILFFLLIITSTLSFGQKLGDYYVSISIDSTQGGRLKFLSDTTVELSSTPRHMSPTFKAVHKYTSTDTTIEIFSTQISTNIPQSIVPHVKPLTSSMKILLIKFNGGFIDYDKSLIYVRKRDFGDNPDIAYIIDGKTYIQDMGITDGYGLLRKRPKANKALQRQLKGLDKENCTIEILRGLNAYKRFGIKRVYGAVVITTKK